MPFYTDQLNRVIEIPSPPKRIVSLVPSQTELLYDLGLQEEVIGITKFCVHPDEWFRKKKRIGGTKNINSEKIAVLQPDLILANKEENVQEQVEKLSQKFPVWVSDVANLDNAYQMMQNIGEITGRNEKASTLVEKIRAAFAHFQTRLRQGYGWQAPDLPADLSAEDLSKAEASPTNVALTSAAAKADIQAAYLIWKDPYLTVGGDTFIHHLMEKAGFQNIFADRLRYPEVSIENLQIANCQLLLLSSEPYPFKQAHLDELQQHLPHTKIVLVNGEMFSWYGSRLLQAPAYFKTLHEQIAAVA